MKKTKEYIKKHKLHTSVFVFSNNTRSFDINRRNEKIHAKKKEANKGNSSQNQSARAGELQLMRQKHSVTRTK